MDESRWAEIRAELSRSKEALSNGDRYRSLPPSEPAKQPDLTLQQQNTSDQERPVAAPRGWTDLEARVRERRIERRAAAARAALSRGSLAEARDALAEIQELDPGSLELLSLSRAYDSAEFDRKTRRHTGPAVMAVAAFLAGLLVASQLGKPNRRIETLVSSQFAGYASPLSYDVVGLDPLPVDDAPVTAQPVATSMTDRVNVEVPTARPTQTVTVAPAVSPAVLPAPAVDAAVAPVVETAPAPRASSETMPVSLPPQNSERLIRQSLERYRAAYERLDARSAQQIWPDVDEPALARAFTGLKSQVLVFEECAIHITGPVATAQCFGSMRYVPRVGSQEPRIESRIWDFTLRQVGSDWKIDAARVNR